MAKVNLIQQRIREEQKTASTMTFEEIVIAMAKSKLQMEKMQRQKKVDCDSANTQISKVRLQYLKLNRYLIHKKKAL